MGNALSELLRRRVLHVVGVYLAASWGLIEFSDWLVSRFSVDGALSGWVLGVLALGLPVVIAGSWALGERGSAPRPITRAPPRSVAVLPFANLGGDAETAFLSVGLADQILTDLARIGDLSVCARTSAFAYRESKEDVRAIGQRLGVRAVLEGSVQRVGRRLRVTTQLVSVEDGFQLWSERFDRDVQDIFEIEDEIAANVARALNAILHEHELRALAKIPTRDIGAFELYARGREFLFQVRAKSLTYAREMFVKALEADPGFALAHAGVAEADALRGMYYPASPLQLDAAERASLRALELDPELAEAHSARGMVLLAAGRPAEAETEFLQASELDPRLFDARYFHGRACFQSGRFAEAAELFRKALELREDYQAAFFAAQATEAAGREDAAGRGDAARFAYATALSVAERHMELNPDDPRAATMRAVSLARLGRTDEAVRWGERALEIDADDGGVRYNVACLFILTGQVDRALDCLEEAAAAGFGSPEWLARDPDLDSVRDHPRFRRIMREGGLPDRAEGRGPFPSGRLRARPSSDTRLIEG